MAHGHAPDPAEGFETVLRTIPMPADLGMGGQIPMGWVLAQLDPAGAVLPGQHFKRAAVLAGLDATALVAAPRLGDLVTFRARILEAGAEHATVEVEVLRSSRGGEAQELVLRTRLVYVPSTADGGTPGRDSTLQPSAQA